MLLLVSVVMVVKTTNGSHMTREVVQARSFTGERFVVCCKPFLASQPWLDTSQHPPPPIPHFNNYCIQSTLLMGNLYFCCITQRIPVNHCMISHAAVRITLHAHVCPLGKDLEANDVLCRVHLKREITRKAWFNISEVFSNSLGDYMQIMSGLFLWNTNN